MTGKFILLCTIVLSLVVFSYNTHSDVLVKDTRINSISTDVPASISSGDIETGDGEVGNYVVLVCANDNGGGNNFNTPQPNGWTELDEGLCGGSFCAHSIWGGFVNDPNSEPITCSWSPNSILFAAGSIRYTGVDPTNPIIDVACDSDTGSPAVAPSVETLAGSQVLRVYTWGADATPMETADFTSTKMEGDLSTNFLIAAGSLEQNKVLVINGESNFSLVDGPTGTDELVISNPTVVWRACTITIRMLNPRNVPTMNDWGLISFAVLTAIAGIWYLKRRKATA